MPRRKRPNDYGTGIPYHEIEDLARVLLPEIQAFFESENIATEKRQARQLIMHRNQEQHQNSRSKQKRNDPER